MLSIIVPVYNVEKYLERCINSLLNQSYKDIEVVIINDGSTDTSGIICDRLAQLDPRVKIFHKKNGGLSDARNYGILKSKGDFISFLDGDDFVTEKGYSELMKEADDQVEVILGRLMNYFSNVKIEPKIKNKSKLIGKTLSGEDYLYRSIIEKTYIVPAPQSIYKRKFIIDNDLFFQKDLLHEDELWTPQVFLKAKYVKVTNAHFYMHVYREGSITHSKDMSKNAEALIYICYKLEKIYNDISNKLLSKIIKDRLVTTYLSAYMMGNFLNKRKNIDFEFLIRNVGSLKNRIKIFIIKISPSLYLKLFNFVK